MTAVLAFGVLLLTCVLLSSLAHRTILSTSIVFLVGGYLLGPGGLGLLHLDRHPDRVGTVAEVALFAVLFTDGMRASAPDLRRAWRVPGRALLLGLPVTLVATALAARPLTDLSWTQAFLLAAALSPTDPVLASAIVGREHVPARLRHLLNVESGLNDGLALPIVIVLLSLAGGGHADAVSVVAHAAGGVVLGAAVPAAAVELERSRWFSTSDRYQPLFALSLGVTIYAMAALTGANEFLAAFAAGVTLASLAPGHRSAFEGLGDLLAEVAKLAALLSFGALISWDLVAQISLGGWALAAFVLLGARPIGLGLALVGASLPLREWAAAAWFGPKGFASVVYGLLILHSDVAGSAEVFHLIAIAVTLSIVAHSSTDVVIASWLGDRRADTG